MSSNHNQRSQQEDDAMEYEDNNQEVLNEGDVNSSEDSEENNDDNGIDEEQGNYEGANIENMEDYIAQLEAELKNSWSVEIAEALIKIYQESDKVEDIRRIRNGTADHHIL